MSDEKDEIGTEGQVDTPEQVESEPEPEPTPSKPKVKLSKLREAARSRSVRYAGIETVQEALAAERLLASGYVDGRFGSMTARAYRQWQRRLGLRGHDADGTPELTSLKHLGDKHGFTVTK